MLALRGAVGFLSRLPVGGGEDAWHAFRRAPAAIPAAGYVVGGLAALPLAASARLSLPPATAAAAYLLCLYLLTGVTHADGLADAGDAAAVHGDADRRLDVLKDAETGVGGTLAVVLAVASLALGASALAGAGPVVALSVAVAAEVGAKAGVAALSCLGSPAHEGLGSQLAAEAGPASLVPVCLVAVAGLPFAPPGARVPAAAALLAAVPVAALVRRWARRALGGVSGDVFGAANELCRVAGVHAGVVAWTLW